MTYHGTKQLMQVLVYMNDPSHEINNYTLAKLSNALIKIAKQFGLELYFPTNGSKEYLEKLRKQGE